MPEEKVKIIKDTIGYYENSCRFLKPIPLSEGAIGRVLSRRNDGKIEIYIAGYHLWVDQADVQSLTSNDS